MLLEEHSAKQNVFDGISAAVVPSVPAKQFMFESDPMCNSIAKPLLCTKMISYSMPHPLHMTTLSLRRISSLGKCSLLTRSLKSLLLEARPLLYERDICTPLA